MKLPLLDYDRLFYSDPDAKCIPYGMKTFTSHKQAESFMSEIYMEDEENESLVRFDAASCSCGQIKGNFYIGMECSNCKSIVRDAFSSEIKFKAWLKLPEYIPPMLHPAAYWVLRKWLGSANKTMFLLDCLLDCTAADKIPPDLLEVVGCGYKNFYENFDRIIMFIYNEYPPFQTAVLKKRGEGIPEYIAEYRDIMFVKHVPILNSSLHLMTGNGTMKYIDATSQFIVKTIVELSNLEFKQSTSARPEMFLDQQTYSIYKSYYEYVFSIMDVKLIGKQGYIRRHMAGARLHFTARAVILPITCEHDLDEIWIPWRAGVSLYGLEIHNILVNRMGYTEPDATTKRHNALFKWDKDISDIFKILMLEAGHKHEDGTFTKFKGLPCTIGRN
jgi:hypothetical protein